MLLNTNKILELWKKKKKKKFRSLVLLTDRGIEYTATKFEFKVTDLQCVSHF